MSFDFKALWTNYSSHIRAFHIITQAFVSIDSLSLLIDPVELGRLVRLDLALLEPESNLLLGVLDGVGTVADVAANIDGEVTTDGSRAGGKGVGGTEDGWILC